MAKDKLVVFEFQGVYRIGWYLGDDDDMGATLGEDLSVLKDATADKDHVLATRVLEKMEGVQVDERGFYWESKKEAMKALRLAKGAMKSLVIEFPDWAKRAISEGWKAPKGWKPS